MASSFLVTFGREHFSRFAFRGIRNAPPARVANFAISWAKLSRTSPCVVAIQFKSTNATDASVSEIRNNDFLLRFRVPPYEMTVFADGRAIIKGTKDPAIARSLYARYLGA